MNTLEAITTLAAFIVIIVIMQLTWFGNKAHFNMTCALQQFSSFSSNSLEYTRYKITHITSASLCFIGTQNILEIHGIRDEDVRLFFQGFMAPPYTIVPAKLHHAHCCYKVLLLQDAAAAAHNKKCNDIVGAMNWAFTSMHWKLKYSLISLQRRHVPTFYSHI